MNEFDKVTEKLRQDPRNASFTERNVGPIYQLSDKAEILIIGQAPGRKVEESGVPFADNSGEKLREWMGVSEEEFYSEKIAILPMDFYYPGKGKTGDLPPRKFIAEEYHPEILKLMSNVKLSILIGQYAMKYYLGSATKKNLTETVRAFQDYLPKYFPIVHPSPLNFRWQAKNPWFEKEVVPVLQEQARKILK